MLKNLFQDFFIWDTLLHTLSGFFLAFIGYKLLKKLNKKKLNKLTIIIFSLCFSMTIGIFWEFVEFSFDLFTLSNMQKDRIVENISSVKLNKKQNEKPVIITDIDHTILYDQKGNGLITIKNGYLDIGLIDTMKDLFVNLLGSIISCFFLYFKRL